MHKGFSKSVLKSKFTTMIKWLFDYLPSIIIFVAFIALNTAIAIGWVSGAEFSDALKIIILFTDMILALGASLPLIQIGISKLNQIKLNDFLALPENNGKITYLVIYDFLSGLALSAFYISVCFFTVKSVHAYAGWFLTGIYLALMIFISFSIAVMALIRVVHVVSTVNKFFKYSLTLTLLVITNEVINIALKMSQTL